VSQAEPLIRNISDTARWVAVYRAQESERPDALFRDPFARRLAGARGEQIAENMEFSKKHSWPFVTRTYLFDQFIAEQVQQGVEMVINLAAGLDARPYRMSLPATLRWIEVDLPEILSYKEEVLGREKPVCRLERVPLDLANASTRRERFEEWGRRAGKVLILTEGLLVYLTTEEVGSLARDLAAPPSFQRWVLDLASPKLLSMLQKNMGEELVKAGAPLKFAPAEGPAFFAQFGWKPIDVRSTLKTARRIRRLSLWMSLLSLLPEPKGPPGSRPWSGICLLGNDQTGTGPS
jgi:methyltransferase (TIGR00027 family)